MGVVKNIIFDLGGVLLDIDYSLTIEAFKSLGIEDFEQLYSQANQTSLFDDFETGKISPSEFCEGIIALSRLDLSEKEIEDAWNAMLLSMPNERVKFLNEIGKNYRTFLLSNTNEIHIDAFLKIIKNENGLSGLDQLFEQVYYSSTLGMRKPHPETFSNVCELNNLIPEETLFIDDSIQHVEGAQIAGLRAIHLDVKSNNVIELLLESLL